MNSRGKMKVALITGASSGIGAAIAREFSRRGFAVGAAARRMDRLDELAKGNHTILPIRCDVTKEGDLERAVQTLRDAHGSIDVVVANAGFGVAGDVEKLSVKDFERQFATNVLGVLRTIHATLGDLRRSRGCLAIMGSVNSYVALPGNSAYAMSKFAVRALADSLSHELSAAGVSVTLICPGFIESEIRKVDNKGILHPHARDWVPSWLPMKADRAAGSMVSAILRRRRQVIITGHGKFIVVLQRFLPRLTSMIISLFRVRARVAP